MQNRVESFYYHCIQNTVKLMSATPGWCIKLKTHTHQAHHNMHRKCTKRERQEALHSCPPPERTVGSTKFLHRPPQKNQWSPPIWSLILCLTTGAVYTWSSDSCLVSSLSDRLPQQGPWGGQPWGFSGPPSRHRSGHRGVKADQPGMLSQISHPPHEAQRRSRHIPTGSLWLWSRTCVSCSVYIEADWNQSLAATLQQHRSAVSHYQIVFHKLMFAGWYCFSTCLAAVAKT